MATVMDSNPSEESFSEFLSYLNSSSPDKSNNPSPEIKETPQSTSNQPGSMADDHDAKNNTESNGSSPDSAGAPSSESLTEACSSDEAPESQPPHEVTPPGSPALVASSTDNHGDETQTDRARRQSQIKLSEAIKKNNSWLTRSDYFKNLVNASFDMVDADKSGDITLDEMYTGLLLIHLKLGVYVGAPACRPASKEYVSEMFHLLKSDDNDTLDRAEFAVVMKILYSQVFTRIVIQWSLMLIILPVLSQYIVEYTSLVCWVAHEFWKDIDDDLDPLQRLLYKCWLSFLTITPDWLDAMGRFFMNLCSTVPWETWAGLPKLLLNSLLVFVVLPYALNHVEDFFKRIAHKNDERVKEKND